MSEALIPASPARPVLRDRVHPKPPRAPGIPLLGSGIEALRDPFRMFARAHQRVGPVFRVRGPGGDMILLAGLAANELLARQGRELFDMARTYRRVTAQLGSERYPNPHDGPEHLRLRRLLASSLTAQAVDAALPVLHEHMDRACAGWPAGFAPLRTTVGPLVADLVSLVSAGRPMGAALAREAAIYGSMLGIVGVGGAFPDFTLRLPRVRAARQRVHDALLDALRDHKARGPGLRREPDLLDALLAEGGELPLEDLLPMAVQPAKNTGIYLYRLVSFALHAALRDPARLDELRAEADLAWAFGPPDLARLKAMEAMERHLLECLRLYPMALALPRVAARPFEFEGFRFEAGTTVFIAGPATHFLPACFPEPDRFAPERMGPGRHEHRRPHAFVPFGAGPHICLARGFSLALVSALLARLFTAFDLELHGADRRLVVRGLPVPIPEARFRLKASPRQRAPLPSAAFAQLDEGAPPLLDGLSAAQRQAAFDALTERELAPGAWLFREGEPTRHFWVIRAGAVEVLDGERVVERLGPGAHLGARGLLQGLPHELSARAGAERGARLDGLDQEGFRLLSVECNLSRGELARVVERRQAMLGLARALPKLKSERLGRLRARCERLELPAGRAILQQGEPAEHFFILVEGQVEVTGRLRDGQDFVLAELVAPDCFGEIGLLERRPRTATVRARTAVTLLRMDSAAFDALIADTSGTGVDLARVAGERLAQALEAGV